jgi:uncharacterized membrane protein
MNKDLFDKKQLEIEWMKLMKLGEKAGCHQRPDRSFFINNYQLPVCARCTGVILGYLLAIPGFLYIGYWKLITLLGCIILLFDWTLQALKIKESTNQRRLITGIIGGYGLMSLQLELFRRLLTVFRSNK